MRVAIVSAEKEIYSGEASAVFAPAQGGEVGILPRHAEMLCRLRPGQVRLQFEDGSDEQLIYVSGGVLEVQPHVVTVLSDTAERAADLDEAAALEAKQRAERALADQAGDFDYAKAQAELAETEQALLASHAQLPSATVLGTWLGGQRVDLDSFLSAVAGVDETAHAHLPPPGARPGCC